MALRPSDLDWEDPIRFGLLEAAWAETPRPSYAQLAKRFGCSRSAIAGVVRRRIHKIPDKPLSDSQRVQKRSRYRQRNPVVKHVHADLWTEAVLTETWAERKARLAYEKAARAAANRKETQP